jgi:hypothetical protein
MQGGFRLVGSSSRSLVLGLAVVCALQVGCAADSSSGIGGEGGSGPMDAGSGTGSGGSSNGSGGTGAGLGSGSAGTTGSAGGPGTGGVSAGTGGITSTGSGGSSTTAGSGGSFGSGGYFSSGGATGFGGASSSAGSTGAGGSTGVGGSTGAGGSTGGGSPGNGGSTGSGGTTGAGGGAAKGGSTGSGGGATGGYGSGGNVGAAGAPGAGGGTSTAFCPAGAIFCADFEEASGVPTNRPVGTATFVDPTEPAATFDGANGVMALDTTAPYDGRQSLKVTPASAAAVRALAVAVPSTFWVRLYIKSDQMIGQMNENGFFGAGTSPTFATGNYVELSEDFNCLFLNKGGTLFPTSQSCGLNAALSANAWHCLVAAFDGATGNLMVYSGPTQIINASAWAPAHEAFNTFELGTFVDNPNGATVWYDDVVISASPLSCP